MTSGYVNPNMTRLLERIEQMDAQTFAAFAHCVVTVLPAISNAMGNPPIAVKVAATEALGLMLLCSIDRSTTRTIAQVLDRRTKELLGN